VGIDDGDRKMMTWTDEQIDQWCLALQAYREDSDTKANALELRALRDRARQEMLLSLTCFLEGQSTLQDFNAIFQQQTHYSWNVFGVRGMSGGMFFNKLIKHIPRNEQLTQQLQMALPVPKDVREGRYQMQALVLFLEGMIATGQTHRSQLQPARFPFFLSAWWHIQDEEQWPRFAGNLRQNIFQGLPLSNPVVNQIDLYFAFRERFLALKESFGISAWELEHFLVWQEEQKKKSEDTPKFDQKQEKHAMSESRNAGRKTLPSGPDRRLYLQWLLAKIGNNVGYQVWIAQQDHGKSWNGESFQDLSISSLSFAENDTLKTQLENVAVLWLRKNEVITAYEIDPKSTEIVTSLLHLYDFGVTCAKHQLQLCLVLPKQYFEQAFFELARPLFRQQREKLRCALMSIEDLASQGEHILRWATSPTIIENLLFSPDNTQG
jgi:hypothetical protein